MIPFESLVLLEINLSKFTVIDHKLEDKLRPKLVAKDFDSSSHGKVVRASGS